MTSSDLERALPLLRPADAEIIAAAPAARDPFVLRAVDRTTELVLVAALLGELGVVLANVLARVYLHHSFLWADEVARLSLSVLAFIGGAAAYRRREHAFVRIVLKLVPRRIELSCLALADILVLFVAGVTGIASAEFQLADEVNTGTYHLRALMDGNSAEIAMNVERYVLPKFKVAVEFSGKS